MVEESSRQDSALEHLTCPICLEAPLLNPVTAACGHSLDLKCFERVASSRNPFCPVCRAKLPNVLQPSVALRECIEQYHGDALRRRKEEPYWEEFQAGQPSAEAVKYLQACLDGSNGSDLGTRYATAVQMLLAFSGTLVRTAGANDVRLEMEARSAMVSLSQAAWYAICNPTSALPSHLGDLLRALQEIGEAAPAPTKIRLMELALEQGQLLWATENVCSCKEVSKWHRTFVSASVLETLLRSCKEHAPGGIQLPCDHVSSIVGLIGEFLHHDCASAAEEEQPFSATDEKPESLRAMLFDTISNLVEVSTSFSTANIEWKRLRTELLSAIADSALELSLPAIRAAANACSNMLRIDASGAFTDVKWTVALLQGTHHRLQDRRSVSDDATARHLLALLGDVHAHVRSPDSEVINLLVGPQGVDFHQSCNFIFSAAGHVEFAASPRQKELKLGALAALKGILNFLNILKKEHAAQGFATHAQAALSMLDKIMFGSTRNPVELKLVMCTFAHFLDLCQRDVGTTPWSEMLSQLAKRPFYMGALSHAAASDFEEAERVESLLQKLGLPHLMLKSHSAPCFDFEASPFGPFGGGQATTERFDHGVSKPAAKRRRRKPMATQHGLADQHSDAPITCNITSLRLVGSCGNEEPSSSASK